MSTMFPRYRGLFDADLEDVDCAALGQLLQEAKPSPATHAILIQLKAGETADLLYTV